MTAASQQLTPFDVANLNRMSVDIGQRWKHWLGLFANEFKERWAEAAHCQIELEFGPQSTISFDRARSEFPRPAVAWLMNVDGPDTTTILILPRPLVLALTLQLLGKPVQELPEDRELTSIESSVCEFVFARIATALSESWPQQETLKVALDQQEQVVHKSRLWEPKRDVMVCNANINIGEGSEKMCWVFPLESLETLLSRLEETPVETTEEVKQLMEHKAREIPIAASVQLGTTELSVTRLAELRPGDVVVFNQRISEPLSMQVDSKTRFHGWLGRKGKRHAFKISEVVQAATNHQRH